jgi:leader peptidase (prepilin peptidase)/N-methyltransferase
MPAFDSAGRVGWRMLYFVVALVFFFGIAVGSFLNVCAYRLPYEKSVLWPSSRCGQCLQPIRWYDNLPLLSYWLLRGRCRVCGATFSSRYFWVELATGLGFVGLFYLEVIRNVLNLPLIRQEAANIAFGLIPPRVCAVFAYHAVLLSFLIVATICDFEHMEIPLSLTMTGTVVGLVGSMLFAWPFPAEPPVAEGGLPQQPLLPPVSGLYPWPVWHDRPTWLAQGSWQLGLATGLAGAAMGVLVLRGVRFLFGLGRGIEGLGVGDADLMMMAGAFVGWQPVLIAFMAAIVPGMLLGIFQVAVRGSQAMPFGPALAIGVMIALLTWPAVGGHFWPVLKSADFLVIVGGLCAAMLLVISFILRITRGKPVFEADTKADGPQKHVEKADEAAKRS